jgi:hypothetical protein
MRYTVDRIEGETTRFAVCEDENRVVVPIPVTSFPFSVTEGTMFQEVAGVYTEIEKSSSLSPSIRSRFDRLRKGKGRNPFMDEQ